MQLVAKVTFILKAKQRSNVCVSNVETKVLRIEYSQESWQEILFQVLVGFRGGQ